MHRRHQLGLLDRHVEIWGTCCPPEAESFGHEQLARPAGHRPFPAAARLRSVIHNSFGWAYPTGHAPHARHDSASRSRLRARVAYGVALELASVRRPASYNLDSVAAKRCPILGQVIWQSRLASLGRRPTVSGGLR
jgi:hypothetical protein